MTEVVAALIRKDNKFLICQRPKNKTRALEWEFVGGKQEPGESLKEALIRECQEELGITVEPLDIFTELTHAYTDITVHLTLFNTIIKSGTPKLLEHNDMQWITAAEIDNYNFCPADKDILNILRTER